MTKQELGDKVQGIMGQMSFAVELQAAEWLDEQENPRRRTVGIFSKPRPRGPHVCKVIDSYCETELE